MIALNMFDQSAIVTGGTAGEAMRQTIEMAKLGDRLGYSRFWISEHHDTEGLAGSSPEVLMAAIAAHTSTIRVGSAGVLLQNYSPYKVAENFRVLEALYPGRIDLGIGRSTGGMSLSREALAYDRTGPEDPESFVRKLLDLGAFLTDALEPGHRFSGLTARPVVPGVPDIWLLGSGTTSAELASRLGAGFSYAHFFKGSSGHEAIARYREQFRPGLLGDKPRVNVCIVVICADTEAEAEELALPVALRMLMIDKGQFGRTYMTSEEAAAYEWSEEDRARLADIRGRMIVGTPARAKSEIERFCEGYGISELTVLTMVDRFEARVRSYELLAEAFGLCGNGAAGAGA